MLRGHMEINMVCKATLVLMISANAKGRDLGHVATSYQPFQYLFPPLRNVYSRLVPALEKVCPLGCWRKAVGAHVQPAQSPADPGLYR